MNSLAQPGCTVTGISDNATTLSTKRLSLLKELLPNLRRVAMLWNADDLGMSLRYEASATAARSIGVTVEPLGVREPHAQRPHEQLGSWARCSLGLAGLAYWQREIAIEPRAIAEGRRVAVLAEAGFGKDNLL